MLSGQPAAAAARMSAAAAGVIMIMILIHEHLFAPPRRFVRLARTTRAMKTKATVEPRETLQFGV